jgi:hypothetical protein
VTTAQRKQQHEIMSGEPPSMQITEIEWRPTINDEVYQSTLILAFPGYPFNQTTVLIKALSFIKMLQGTPGDLATKDARRQFNKVKKDCTKFDASATTINGGTGVSHFAPQAPCFAPQAPCFAPQAPCFAPQAPHILIIFPCRIFVIVLHTSTMTQHF